MLAEGDPGVGNEVALRRLANQRPEGLHRGLAVVHLRLGVAFDEEHFVAARIRRVVAEQIRVERERLLAEPVAQLGREPRLGTRRPGVAIARLEPALHLLVVLLHFLERGDLRLLLVQLAELEDELGLPLPFDEGKDARPFLDELIALRSKLGVLARIASGAGVFPAGRTERARRGSGSGEEQAEGEGDHGCSGSFRAGHASLIVAW